MKVNFPLHLKECEWRYSKILCLPGQELVNSHQKSCQSSGLEPTIITPFWATVTEITYNNDSYASFLTKNTCAFGLRKGWAQDSRSLTKAFDRNCKMYKPLAGYLEKPPSFGTEEMICATLWRRAIHFDQRLDESCETPAPSRPSTPRVNVAGSASPRSASCTMVPRKRESSALATSSGAVSAGT